MARTVPSSLLALVLASGLAPLTLRADMSFGVAGMSVGPVKGQDDLNSASTRSIFYLTSSLLIPQALALGNFPVADYVFAGQGVAVNIPNIPASDFTVSQYKPWVVNNNSTANFVSGPDVANGNPVIHSRNITNQDAGGADIVITYTPRANDPMDVNFIQAVIDRTSGGNFSRPVLDGASISPYYNDQGIAGTGTTRASPDSPAGTIPLMSSAANPAWMVDIPATCENGVNRRAPDPCTGGTDELFPNETVVFETFIESDTDIGGVDYRVLYGGLRWGYTYGSEDVPLNPSPEPSGYLPLAILFTGLAAWRHRRQPPSGVERQSTDTDSPPSYRPDARNRSHRHGLHPK